METSNKGQFFLMVGKDFLKGEQDYLESREKDKGRASQAEEILQMKAPRKEKEVGCSQGKENGVS